MTAPDIASLTEKAAWLRRETLLLHQRSPETRLASSLSAVELFVALYYGGILRHEPKRPLAEERDRLIISKGHGSVSLYPVLADRGYFPWDELERIGQPTSFLGAIPDTSIPGYETINGALGLGLGVACGSCIGLSAKGSDSTVFVLSGDGELFAGMVWEAAMFAGHHKLDNLILLIDANKRCMLDFCEKIIDLEPLEAKFESFGWRTLRVDGHDMKAVTEALSLLKAERCGKPKVLIADTVKGKGVPRLECDPLCHIKSLSSDEVTCLLKENAQ